MPSAVMPEVRALSPEKDACAALSDERSVDDTPLRQGGEARGGALHLSRDVRSSAAELGLEISKHLAQRINSCTDKRAGSCALRALALIAASPVKYQQYAVATSVISRCACNEAGAPVVPLRVRCELGMGVVRCGVRWVRVR